MSVRDNRDAGALFEESFQKTARRAGLLCKKNDLTAKYAYNGRLKAVKSNLDFLLADQHGRVGFFDCKSFATERFSFSDINKNQMDLAADYCLWNVPAGFVCWLRSVNRVCFYSGSVLTARGPGCSFGIEEAIVLGRGENFELKRLLGA